MQTIPQLLKQALRCSSSLADETGTPSVFICPTSMSEHITLESVDQRISGIEVRLIAFEARTEARWDATIPHLATKADVEALRGDMQKWMLATVIALYFGLWVLILSISNHYNSGNARAAPPPVVYYLPAVPAPPAKAP